MSFSYLGMRIFVLTGLLTSVSYTLLLINNSSFLFVAKATPFFQLYKSVLHTTKNPKRL